MKRYKDVTEQLEQMVVQELKVDQLHFGAKRTFPRRNRTETGSRTSTSDYKAFRTGTSLKYMWLASGELKDSSDVTAYGDRAREVLSATYLMNLSNDTLYGAVQSQKSCTSAANSQELRPCLQYCIDFCKHATPTRRAITDQNEWQIGDSTQRIRVMRVNRHNTLCPIWGITSHDDKFQERPSNNP
uniref:Astacin domain-containing protein n=1 Tax=Steinernema glaseri TaxID=37863 RepID=A0A1I7Z3A2_9BILA